MDTKEYEAAWQGEDRPADATRQAAEAGATAAAAGASPDAGPVSEAASAGAEAAAAAGVDPTSAGRSEGDEYAKAYDELPADTEKAPPRFQSKDDE